MPVRAADVLLVVPVWSGRGILGQSTEHRVHEAALAGIRESDRLRHCGVRWDPCERELIGTQADHGAGAGAHTLHRPGRPHADRPVQTEQPAECPERELGGQGAIPFGHARASEQRGKDAVGVGAAVGHTPDRLEGHGTRGGRHTKVSPAVGRAPRAHSVAVMCRRPAGATSSSPIAPDPATDHDRVLRDRYDGARWAGDILEHGRSEDLEPRAAPGRRRPGLRRERPDPTDKIKRRLAPSEAPLPRPELERHRRFTLLRLGCSPALCQIGQGRREQLGAELGEALPKRSRILVRPDPDLGLREHRPRVQPLVDLHDRDSRDRVSGQDRVLHGRRAAPPWQERQMDVHRAEAGCRERRRPEQLTVGDHDEYIGRHRLESRHDSGVRRRPHLRERHVDAACRVGNGRRSKSRAAPGRARRVRHDERDLDGLGTRQGDRARRPTRGRCPRRRPGSVRRPDYPTSSRCRFRGSTRPSSMRRSSARTLRRPSSSSRSMKSVPRR